ncbi:type II toxin-antitoxin system VapC family toxin [Salana multivorans]
MSYLLDTHLLLWTAYTPERLSTAARNVIADPSQHVLFSAASIWEVTIKSGLGREDFDVDPRALRRGLLTNDFEELTVTSAHGIAVGDLPALHRDPFDRMLLAQARVEGVTLLTSDELVARYGTPARLV